MAQEWRWRFRDAVRRRSVAIAYSTVEHPHRQYIMAHFRSYEPIQAILEIGCDYGENLICVSKQYPSVRIHGLDINRKAVALGRKLLKELGINHVSLDSGKADDLTNFPDKSMDIVFTDACLMYVGPDKIRRVIAECGRVAKKGIVLNEWHFEGSPSQSSYYKYHFAHWVYDYVWLIRELFPQARINTIKIPESIYGGPWWKEFGFIIEIHL